MLRNYKNDKNHVLNTVHSMWGYPGDFKRITDTEQHLATRNQGKSGKGPHRDPRVFYVLLFTTIIIVICCVVGVFIGNKLGGDRGTVLGIIIGIIVGLITGPRLVVYVNKLRERRWSRSLKKHEKDKNNSQGPFIS